MYVMLLDNLLMKKRNRTNYNILIDVHVQVCYTHISIRTNIIQSKSSYSAGCSLSLACLKTIEDVQTLSYSVSHVFRICRKLFYMYKFLFTKL